MIGLQQPRHIDKADAIQVVIGQDVVVADKDLRGGVNRQFVRQVRVNQTRFFGVGGEKYHRVSYAGCFNVLRKMTALRQIEAAELMSTVSNYSATLAKTILAASATEQLAKPGTRKAPRALSPEQVAQLEQEMTSSQA